MYYVTLWGWRKDFFRKTLNSVLPLYYLVYFSFARFTYICKLFLPIIRYQYFQGFNLRKVFYLFLPVYIYRSPTLGHATMYHRTLAVSSFVLLLQATLSVCRSVRFEIDLTWQTHAPDGNPREMILMNGQFPGPQLNLQYGDRVEVDIVWPSPAPITVDRS